MDKNNTMKVTLINKTTNEEIYAFSISNTDIMILNSDFNQSIQIKLIKNIFDELTKANYPTLLKNTQIMFDGNLSDADIKKIQEETNDYFLYFPIPHMDDDMRDRFYNLLGIPYVSKELCKVNDLDREFKINNTDLIIDGDTIDICESIINEKILCKTKKQK